jgi:hypothetical protein
MKKEAIQHEEAVSSDVRAFCALITRILMRCLQEHNADVMKRLSLSPQQEQLHEGENHVPAASI